MAAAKRAIGCAECGRGIAKGEACRTDGEYTICAPRKCVSFRPVSFDYAADAAKDAAEAACNVGKV